MRVAALFILCRLFVLPVSAQPAPPPIIEGESFRFVRVMYDDNGGRGGRGGRYGGWRRRGAWATDWPTAEINLHQAIERTTKIPLAGEPIYMTLRDKNIFQYPVLYLTEPGYWLLHDDEAENLREYVDRGGFLIVDDFHDYGRGMYGPQWENFYVNIKRVFPEREPIELPRDHPIWSIFYDVDPLTAVSTKGPRFAMDDDMYFGIFDDQGRMMVIICYNQDIGDGWEWPGRNLGEASTVSFQMAINFIMYALSH